MPGRESSFVWMDDNGALWFDTAHRHQDQAMVQRMDGAHVLPLPEAIEQFGLRPLRRED